jgi:GNAT superfamily N-acetyltransferase
MDFGMEIREMTIADLPSVAVLAEQLGYTASLDQFKKRFKRISEDITHQLLVACADSGRVIGWIHFYESIPLEAEHSIQISALVVDETLRKTGVGKALMTRAEAWAHCRNVPLVSLRSQTRREDAHAFYERLGYKKVKTSFKFQKKLGESAT